jgi:Trypsin-co-occurring domain 1
MKRIVEFPSENDNSIILVEVNEPGLTDSPIGITDDRIGIREQITQRSTKSFESALEIIKPVANAILTKVGSLHQPADEIEVKFGIKISSEFKAVVASGSGEVNYEITLKWKREIQK